MKVLVVNTMAPFVWGGAEELARSLIENLRALDHDAELLRMPFSWEPYGRLSDEIARFSIMRLPNVDKVISLKFPAYFLSAANHTTWLTHQYRQAYDLWGTPHGNIPDTPDGRRVREIIKQADLRAFSSRRLFSISQIVSDRLYDSTGLTAEPLRAPINDPNLFLGGESEGYVLAAGRINSTKRQHLFVEAMAHLPQSYKLIVAGPPDSQADAEQLRAFVAENDLESRVTLDLRFLAREELAAYVNAASVVAYAPFNEDSYGYVTMEAFQAGKPVVTTEDAGEVLELVIDGETGAVASAEPLAVAAALSQLLANPARAARMGAAGRALWLSKNVNWPSNIARLLGS